MLNRGIGKLLLRACNVLEGYDAVLSRVLSIYAENIKLDHIDNFKLAFQRTMLSSFIGNKIISSLLIPRNIIRPPGELVDTYIDLGFFPPREDPVWQDGSSR